MTEAHPAHSTGGASRDAEGDTAALGLTEWLCLDHRPQSNGHVHSTTASLSRAATHQAYSVSSPVPEPIRKVTITARVRVLRAKNQRGRLGRIARLPQLSATRDKAMPS
jgi:hypothetical protein